MDQDFGYEDLIDKKSKRKGREKGQSRPILPILIILLVVVLLGAGGFLVWSRPELLSFLGALRPAPAQAAEVPATPTPELPTETAAATQEVAVLPTATLPPPTEEAVAAAPEAFLPLPEFGRLVHTRSSGSDLEDQAVKHANNMAIREPFHWEYMEFDAGTLVRDVERYYIGLVNKDMGYLMTFNEKYPNSAMAVFKFKQDGRRLTIQLFEGNQDRLPTAFLYYEGW